jgi:hypothetical protein
MAPAWHAKAKKLRLQGQSLSMIAANCDVSPQAVSIALDPKKQARRRKYVKLWKRKKYKEPEFREQQRKLDRESKRRQRRPNFLKIPFAGSE